MAAGVNRFSLRLPSVTDRNVWRAPRGTRMNDPASHSTSSALDDHRRSGRRARRTTRSRRGGRAAADRSRCRSRVSMSENAPSVLDRIGQDRHLEPATSMRRISPGRRMMPRSDWSMVVASASGSSDRGWRHGAAAGECPSSPLDRLRRVLGIRMAGGIGGLPSSGSRGRPISRRHVMAERSAALGWSRHPRAARRPSGHASGWPRAALAA